MMKKLTSLLLSAALMISLLACGAFAAKTKSGVRIAGLKGPTTMGLVNLLDMERSGKASQHYDLQLYGAADEIVPKLIKGELDMAAILPICRDPLPEDQWRHPGDGREHAGRAVCGGKR